MSDHTQLSGRAYIAIGLMLFALFFGAGNLIFPATLGQHAGTNVWWAILGFIVLHLPGACEPSSLAHLLVAHRRRSLKFVDLYH